MEEWTAGRYDQYSPELERFRNKRPQEFRPPKAKMQLSPCPSGVLLRVRAFTENLKEKKDDEGGLEELMKQNELRKHEGANHSRWELHYRVP
jgi:hypothetical protein